MVRLQAAPKNTLVALDIGTTKICVFVAQPLDEERMEIIGIGKAPSQGLARGVVVDAALTVKSIKAALAEAELMTGFSLNSAYIGISGNHVQSRLSQGVVAIKGKHIKEHDIAHVLAAARAVPLPEGQHILHVLPNQFIIDGDCRVRDPLGLHGVRLEAQVHIISGALASLQNLVRCCELAGVAVRDVILEPIASADAVLSDDEKEMGAFILDIGGGTADFAFYHQGTIKHTYIVPLGGALFTQDVALCLRATMQEAERLKREYGCASEYLLEQDAYLEIESVQGNEQATVTRGELVAVLASRTHELFSLIKENIDKHNLEAPAGLVLTGGGSLLAGIDIVARSLLQIPVRLGVPRGDFGFKETLRGPQFATVYGLLMHGMKKQGARALDAFNGPLVMRLFSRMKSWIADFF